MPPKPKAVIKCRRCGKPLPLEDRLLDWLSGKGRRDHLEYLKPVHPDVTVGELPGLFRTLMGKGDTEQDDDTEREAA